MQEKKQQPDSPVFLRLILQYYLWLGTCILVSSKHEIGYIFQSMSVLNLVKPVHPFKTEIDDCVYPWNH